MLGFSTFGAVGACKVQPVLQSERAECGLACIAMIANFYGLGIDLPSLRRRFPISQRGMTLMSIAEVANDLGLVARGLRIDLDYLGELRLPAILHWNRDHFVVLTAVNRSSYRIADPKVGERAISLNEMSGKFTGVVLELEPTHKFERKELRKRLSTFQLLRGFVGLKRVLVQIFILSMAFQALLLIAPFYLQLVLDEVLLNSNVGILGALAAGFAALAVISVAAQALRAKLILHLGAVMMYQFSLNLFQHLLKLPLPFFERRHVGDVVSRFRSTESIKRVFTEGLIAAVVDGVMAFGTLALMLAYSGLLSIVSLSFLALYLFYRAITFDAIRRREEAQIIAGGVEQTNFLETFRSIATIKIFLAENARRNAWQNKLSRLVNAELRVGSKKIEFDVIQSLLFRLEDIGILYLAAKMALASSLSVGMIFAFVAYRLQFRERAVALIERGLEFRMLDLHLERISEIAFEPCEHLEAPTLSVERKHASELIVRNVSYRYSMTERYVLENVSLMVDAGECIAIIGPSGCGKTTLAKVILGLLVPEIGDVEVDGMALSRHGRNAYRGRLAAILQSDCLFEGTISDNIAFFDPHPDMEQVVECARLAAIDETIRSMPLGYETRIGDMGSSLSGGQQQRVLLARALYRDPSILLMDEATAHLDVPMERSIVKTLSGLGMTRIIIAHRPEIIRMADRVVLIESGRLQEISRGDLDLYLAGSGL